VTSPARVFLVNPAEIIADDRPLMDAPYRRIRECFSRQAETRHELVDDADGAEIVLVSVLGSAFGPCFERLRRSPLARRHRDRIVVYCPDDNQFPAVRGIYPSAIEPWVSAGWARSAHYVSEHFRRFDFVPLPDERRDLLFSFVGSSRTHRLRERLVTLRHPRGVVEDVSPPSSGPFWWATPDAERCYALFQDVTSRSKFVLCPQGMSPSSIRLFEVMESGAVPVVISDRQVLPGGPDWADFLVRIPEKEIESIPRKLEHLEPDAARRGAAARGAWERFFAPEATADSLVRWARELLQGPARRPMALNLAEYLSPKTLRAKLKDRLTR